MLSAHGLIIIAEEIQLIQNYTFTSLIKFWIASDIGEGKTQRFLLNLFVPIKELDTVKSKIQIGKVCEIVKADITEVVSKFENPNRFTTSITISCKLENFKFLSACIYYEDMNGITTKEDTNV